MLPAVNRTQTKVIELSRDPAKGTDSASKFHISAISARYMANIRDKATRFVNQSESQDAATQIASNSATIDIVCAGLTGWENFKDHKGDDVKFTTHKKIVGGRTYEVMSEELVDLFTEEDLLEITNAVNDLNSVPEKVRKKSAKS